MTHTHNRAASQTAVGGPYGNAPRAATQEGGIRTPIEHVGDVLSFSLKVFRELPAAVRLYPSEIFRHAGLMIRSNGPVVLFMLFMLGGLIGITTSFLFESLGLESYVGAMGAVALLRGVIEIVFGWILAAKMGCGIVAELGAMRISEEIDAMEVMGIRSVPYLVGTRLAASLLVLPFLFAASLAVTFLSLQLFFVELLDTVSVGGYNYVLFLLQGGRNLAIALFWGTLVGIIVTLVSCYYGYNAKGGPVGVGRNTAQSMLVNLLLISLTALILAQLFYANVLSEAFGT